MENKILTELKDIIARMNKTTKAMLTETRLAYENDKKFCLWLMDEMQMRFDCLKEDDQEKIIDDYESCVVQLDEAMARF